MLVAAIPSDVQFILDWNPVQLQAGERTPSPIEENGSKRRKTKSSRPPAFYDKHLARHLILHRVVHLPSLASEIAACVDKTINDVNNLPIDLGKLLPSRVIQSAAKTEQRTFAREDGVAEKYDRTTRTYCVPVASTLFLHPFASEWNHIIDWTREIYNSRFAIADGTLRFITDNNVFLQNVMDGMDLETRGLIAHLKASTLKDLNTFEFKSLQVGDDAVMKEILDMAANNRFGWILCVPNCTKHSEEQIQKFHSKVKDAPDAENPPWNLPKVNHILPVAPLHQEEPSDDEVGEGSQTDGAQTGEKRKRKDGGKPRKARKEVTAQSLLQQAWAQAVRANTTIIVLHSGNHEFVCIRHRKLQTLFISNMIRPYACDNPRYGKLHVGIAIATLMDAFDRAKQDIRNMSQTPQHPVAPAIETRDNSLPKPASRPPNPKPRHGGSSGGSLTTTSGQKSSHQQRSDYLCLSLRYGIYNSIHPSLFERVSDTETHPRSTNPDLTLQTLDVVLTSEFAPGSTGFVHAGELLLESDQAVPICVKLAFCEDDKETLKKEHEIYQLLETRGIRGTPLSLGVYRDTELDDGIEGPYALVMTNVGRALSDLDTRELSPQSRSDFLSVLRGIHDAGIIHGDIRRSNLCISKNGDANIIDFSHGRKSKSARLKSDEVDELCELLGIKKENTSGKRERSRGVKVARSPRRSKHCGRWKERDESLRMRT